MQKHLRDQVHLMSISNQEGRFQSTSVLEKGVPFLNIF